MFAQQNVSNTVPTFLLKDLVTWFIWFILDLTKTLEDSVEAIILAKGPQSLNVPSLHLFFKNGIVMGKHYCRFRLDRLINMVSLASLVYSLDDLQYFLVKAHAS